MDGSAGTIFGSGQLQDDEVEGSGVSLEQEPVQGDKRNKKQEVADALATAEEKAQAGAMRVKGESKEKRVKVSPADISLDKLRINAEFREYESKAAETINAINLSEALQEQEARNQGFSILRDVSIVMLSTFMYRDKNFEEKLNFSDFSNLANLPGYLDFIKSKPTENSAAHKLFEFQAHQDAVPVQEFKAEWWPHIVSNARQMASDMRILHPRPGDNDAGEKSEKKSFLSPVGQAWDKLPGWAQLSILAAGACAAGVVIYKIAKKLFPEEAPAAPGQPGAAPAAAPSTGFWGWLGNIIKTNIPALTGGAGALSLFGLGLGRAMGPESILKDFFKKQGWDLDNSVLAQAAYLATHGRASEIPGLILNGIDKNADAHKAMAEAITQDMKAPLPDNATKEMKEAHARALAVPVTGRTLYNLREEKFETFIVAPSQKKDELSASIRAGVESHGVVGKALGAAMGALGTDTPQENMEQMTVRAYFLKHEARLKQMMATNGTPINEATTLDQVLEVLKQNTTGATPTLPAPEPPGVAPAAAALGVAAAATQAPGENQEAGPVGPVTEAVALSDTTAAAVDSGAMDNIKQAAAEKHNLRAFLNKHDGHWATAMLSPFQLVSELYAACHKDKVSVIVADTGIYLVLKDAAILLSAVDVLTETAKNIIAAPFSDEVGWSDGITTFAKGSAAFAMVGVGTGALVSKLRGGGIFPGMAGGGIRGALFTIEIPRLHIVAGEWMYRRAVGVGQVAQKGARQVAEALDARGHGDQFVVKKFIDKTTSLPELWRNQAAFHAEVFVECDDVITKGKGQKFWTAGKWWGKLNLQHATELRENSARRFIDAHKEMRAAQGLAPIFRESDIGNDRLNQGIGEFREEHRMRAAAMRPLNTDSETFKNRHGTYKTQIELKDDAARLRRELADPNLGQKEPLPLGQKEQLRKVKVRELIAISTCLDPKLAGSFTINTGVLKSMDKIAKAEALESMARQIEATEKGVQARFNIAVEKIVAKAKSQKISLSHPSVTAKLEALDRTLMIPFARQKQTALAALFTEYEKLPAVDRPASLKASVANAADSWTTRLARGAKGRCKLMVLMTSLMFVTDQIIHRNDPERELEQIVAEFGPQFGQLLLDVMPFVGTYSNFHSAFSGKQLVDSERDVSGAWDRASNVLWGAVGLTGDALMILTAIPSGGTSFAANVMLRLAKAAKAGSKVAPQLIRMWPKIEKIAERMGGFYQFAKKLGKMMNKENLALVRGLRRVQMGAMAAGSVMLAGSVGRMVYGFVDTDTELQIPQDIAGTQAANDDTEVAAETPPAADFAGEPPEGFKKAS
ncbi:MAG: hypothetical protein AAB588_03865 [Patescibacteria group bacterium]